MSLKSEFEKFGPGILITEGNVILESRVKPLLKACKEYNRITAFFSPTVIKAIFTELSACLSSGGNIKLVIGIHDASKLIPVLNEIDKSDPQDRFVHAVKKILHNDIEACLKLMDHAQNIPKLFSELIRQKFIEIRFACVKRDYEKYEQTGEWPENDSLFHPKISIFRDDTDAVVLSGSVNETNKGYSTNVEHVKCINSWDNADIVSDYENTFELIWEGRHGSSRTIPFSNVFRDLIQMISTNSGEFKKLLEKNLLTSFDFVQMMSNSPLFYPYSFTNVRLLPHQRSIYNTSLSRWPVRALIADEVGLGKTIEAGSIISYLQQFSEIKRTVLLVPASLRYQWQTEMWNLFGMEFFIYEPQTKKLVLKPNNKVEREIFNVELDQIFKQGVDRIIFSWHYVRKPDSQGAYKLKPEDNIDLLLVDEVHSARLKRVGREELESTQLYNFLWNILPHIPHRLFLTATPQQTDFLDYHGLVKLVSGYDNLEEDSLKRIAKLNGGQRLSTHEKLKSVEEIYDLRNVVTTIPALECDLDDPPSVLSVYSDEFYIRNHPTTIFTLRNTRELLKTIGYIFPEVSLFSQAISIEENQRRIFSLVNNYIGNILFEFERIAIGTRGLGFVKTVYSQRLVSSFSACYDTLSSRKLKLSDIIANGYLEQNRAITEEETEGEEGDLTLNTERINADAQLIALARRDIGYINEVLLNIERYNLRESVIYDPKINKAIEIVMQHLKGGDQVIVFSRFTSTTNFIVSKLKEDKELKFGRFQGDLIQTVQGNTIENHSRTTIAEEFRRGDFPLMICSDAASEGLNLQAANVLINVDVPWNPARLLQRFGRIDRFGQKKSMLYFYNLFYPDSIEDRMYSRLHQRNQDFRTVLGATPEVTTIDHIDELVYQQGLTIDSRSLEYKNTMISYTTDSIFRIHELILDRLRKREDFIIKRNIITYNNDFFEYSLDEMDTNYLDLNHKIFSFIIQKENEQKYPAYVLKNNIEHSFFICIKKDETLIPIDSIALVLDYIILNEFNIPNPTIIYTENNLSEMLSDILNKNKGLMVNHNRIQFSDQFISLYQGLYLEKVGSISSRIIVA